MKKIIIIIFIAFLIFQTIVLATEEITIGVDAIDRAGTGSAGRTRIVLGGTASGTGTITSIEIWAATAIQNCKVATFTEGAENVFSTRDTVTLGNVAAGSKQTITEDEASDPIALSVVEGDFIGMYYTIGTIEYDTLGGEPGLVELIGDFIPCTDEDFSAGLKPTRTFSLYGTGTTEEEEEEVNVILFGTNL